MGANTDGRDAEEHRETDTVGVNVYSKDLDRVKALIGEYGSRSAYVRDAFAASLDAYEIAEKHNEPVMPHEVGDLIRDAVRFYLENKDKIE